MEDTHIAEFNIGDNGVHIFAVFDGHGGKINLYQVVKFLNSLKNILFLKLN